MPNAKILIVEDDAIVRDDIAERLAGLGYNVCARIPQDSNAIKTAAEMAPDLAVIGVGHPDSMNGINIAEKVNERLSIPIIYLTDFVNEALLQRVKPTREIGHVFKPYDTNQLLLSIENHLTLYEQDRKGIEKEQKSETILDSIGEAVIAANKDGLITYMNRVAEQLTGWSRKELDGRTLVQLLKTDTIEDRNPVLKSLIDIIKYGIIVSRMDHNTTLICKDGKKIPIDFTATPITDVHGEVSGVVITLRDTSELKAAEHELEQTVQKLQNQTQLMETVFDSISDGVVATDETGNFLLVNPSAEKIVGMGKTDSQPGEWSDTYGTFYPDKVTPYPSNDLPLVHAMHGKETDGVDLFQRNAMKPEGVYINVSGRPLLEKDGSVCGGVIIFRDVTKLKETEVQLEQTIDKLTSQTQFMESIFESISDGVIVSNENNEIKIFNPSAERILNHKFWKPDSKMWTFDALISDIEFYFPDRVTPYPLDELPLRRAIRGEETDEVNMFISKKEKFPDGTFISVSGRPIRNQWGIENGGVVVFRDVTQRILEEEALAQAFAQGRLEIVDTILHNIGNAINSVMVGIGTLQDELVDDKLIQRFNALANAIKKHQTDWIDYIKNDPQGQKVLPFVLGLAEDFSNQNEKLTRTVERITSRSTHIADIIRTQKSYSNVSVVRKDINLHNTVADAAKLLQDSIERRGIQIKIDCTNAPMEVRVEESQFHQTIVNLIKNSIEAIDELTQTCGLNETPSIAINGYIKDDFLIIDITDNGIGLEPENYTKIFAAGYTTKKFGSGLGLHSSANFIIGCGGQILPMSEGIGKGTTIRITLQLVSVTP